MYHFSSAMTLLLAFRPTGNRSITLQRKPSDERSTKSRVSTTFDFASVLKPTVSRLPETFLRQIKRRALKQA